ncbi:MAG: hypothetical protein KBA72_12410 [Thermoanaerobaculia bacterium]|nr:hypothetical protein [Thermoanaerobaculia bacterium]
MDAQQLVSPAAPVRPSPREAGFSIIEGLIAALLLLVVTLGILPLFSRAMNNNVKGNDSTRQSNGAITGLESAVSLPFNSGALTIPAVPAGQTSLVLNETLALKKVSSPTGGSDLALSSRWELPADLGSDDVPLMNRVRTLQQYSFDDYNLNQSFDFPLPGETQARLVHFKVLDISLTDATGPETRSYNVRMVKAF